GETDVILPAGVFGRQSWIGRLPGDLQQLLISPTPDVGHFGFELVSLERLSLPRLFGHAWRRKPERAALAILNTILGLTRHRDINLAIALRGHALENYAEWRKAGERTTDPEGIDRLPDGVSHPHVRIIAAPTEARNIEAFLKKQPYDAWSVREGGATIDEPELDPKASTHLIEDLDDDGLVVFLPSGARLSDFALISIAGASAIHPEADGLLGDHDHIDRLGRHRSPRFWPGQDPLLATNGYFSGPALFWRVRHLRARATSGGGGQAPRIVPIQRVTMSLPESRADTLAPAAPAFPARGEPQPARTARATVIVPTRDRLDLLKPCVASIMARLGDLDRLMIVDNDSRDEPTLAFLADVARDPRVLVRRHPGPFNYARICNEAARASDAELLLFLNNDTEVVSSDWIDRMAALAVQPTVGAVGAQLIFPSGKLQHGGVVAGTFGLAGHFEAGSESSDGDFFARRRVPHTVSAVTAACMMVERAKFFAVGGFDDVNLPIELNDIDLCLRLCERGERTAIEPRAVLVHHESASRGRTGDDDYGAERLYFRRRWRSLLRNDPHFHPALSLDTTDPRLG
ncbi:MAG: glycosyltransferase family 2 protein, partial [Beijerinckiaceae bacterium]